MSFKIKNLFREPLLPHTVLSPVY